MTPPPNTVSYTIITYLITQIKIDILFSTPPQKAQSSHFKYLNAPIAYMWGLRNRQRGASVVTFVSLHAWVLLLSWAESRVISPVTVHEDPGAGGGQGAGPPTGPPSRHAVWARAGTRAEAGAGAWTGTRWRAGGREGVNRGALRSGVLVVTAGRGLPVSALVSPLLLCITVGVHSQGTISLQRKSTGATLGSIGFHMNLFISGNRTSFYLLKNYQE